MQIPFDKNEDFKALKEEEMRRRQIIKLRMKKGCQNFEREREREQDRPSVLTFVIITCITLIKFICILFMLER